MKLSKLYRALVLGTSLLALGGCGPDTPPAAAAGGGIDSGDPVATLEKGAGDAGSRDAGAVDAGSTSSDAGGVSAWVSWI